mgnify:CR=1 FL=1
MIVAPYVFIRNYSHALLLQYFFIFTLQQRLLLLL